MPADRSSLCIAGLYEPGVAAGYALDPAPGRHTSTNSGVAFVAAFVPYFDMLGIRPAARYDYAGKGTIQAIAMPLYRAYDSLGLCQFALMMGQPPFLEWVNAATGWEIDKAGFFKIGKRITGITPRLQFQTWASPAIRSTRPGTW